MTKKGASKVWRRAVTKLEAVKLDLSMAEMRASDSDDMNGIQFEDDHIGRLIDDTIEAIDNEISDLDEPICVRKRRP